MLSAVELKSRVMKLLKEVKGYSGSEENAVLFLAKELYRQNLISVPPRKKRSEKEYLSQDEKDRANINIVAKNIRGYFRPSVTDGNCIEESSMPARYVVALAQYFGCTTDYLLLESSTVSHPKALSASRSLNLRPVVCTRISNYSEPQRLMLSELIFDGHGKDHRDYLADLLDGMYRYAVIASDPGTIVTIQNPDLFVFDEYGTQNHIRDLLKFKVVKDFENCLDHASKLTGIKRLQSMAHTVADARKTDNTK